MTNLKSTKQQQFKQKKKKCKVNLPKVPRFTFESIFFSEDEHFNNIFNFNFIQNTKFVYFLIFFF